MYKLSHIEKQYLGRKKFLYQNLNLDSIYKIVMKNKCLYSNVYNKRLLGRPRSQSDLCLRQIRRNLGFPIKGQRTSSNGKTAKKRLWRKLKN